ncbi:hypothetical protein FQA39_LY11432 [Lamprigera yunnana]|nr:hypothetical protein FQA39_LY11432 [Lamprigera yunnana]
MDRMGLIGAECTCIHNSQWQVEKALESTCFQKRAQQQVKSSDERGASVGSVKSAFTIYWLPLYLLKFPVYNLPLAQVIIDALQLNFCKQLKNEDVRTYNLRLENLQCQLINASCLNKTDAESKAVKDYIQNLTVAIFTEDLQQPLKNIMKSRNLTILSDAIQKSVEEEHIMRSETNSRINFQILQTVRILLSFDKSGEQEISTANVEDTENLPLSLLSKNNPNAGTPQKIDNKSTTCEIHKFLLTPKFKVKTTAPHKKSLNYRAQEVTKDLFGDNATNSTLQITVPSSRVEDVPGTTSMIKTNTKTPKSASVTSCTSAQPAVAATRKRTSVKTAFLTAHKLTGSKPKHHDNKPPWYCRACNEDRVDDIRQCLTCDVWYHELCVELTPADKIFYFSRDCLEKKRLINIILLHNEKLVKFDLK